MLCVNLAPSAAVGSFHRVHILQHHCIVTADIFYIIGDTHVFALEIPY